MSYQPVSGIVPQYSNDSNELASGYYLKFYIANTTTPLSMATDSGGGTLLVKCKLNPDGLPISNPLDNDTVFVPHVSQSYRLVIYRDEDDANADNTAAAFLNVPSLEPLAPGSVSGGVIPYVFDSRDDEALGGQASNLLEAELATGDYAQTAGKVTPGDGEGQLYEIVDSGGDVTLDNGKEAKIVSKHNTATGTQTVAGALDDRVIHLASAEDLRTTEGVIDNQQASVKLIDGYGWTHVYWDSNSTESDDGETVFAVTGVSLGRWKTSATHYQAPSRFQTFPISKWGTIFSVTNAHKPAAEYDSVSDRTYMVFCGPGRAPHIIYYDHAGLFLSEAIKIDDYPIAENDDHGVPTITIDLQGYLHVFYGSHNTDQYHARSDSPRDITSWTPQALSALTDMTYPNLCVDSVTGDIYAFFRAGSTHGSVYPVHEFASLLRSVDNGVNWTDIGPIIDTTGFPGAASDAYTIGSAQEYNGKIYVAWLIADGAAHDDVRKNIYVAYYDPSDGNMYTVDGTSLGTTITEPEHTSCAVRIADNTNYVQMVISDAGEIYVTWTEVVTSEGMAGYFVARWNGTSWDVVDTGARDSTIWDAAALRIKEDSTLELFAITNTEVVADPVVSQGTNRLAFSGNLDVYSAPLDASAFTFSQRIVEQGNHPGQGVRGIGVPRNAKRGLKVLFATGGFSNTAYTLPIFAATDQELNPLRVTEMLSRIPSPLWEYEAPSTAVYDTSTVPTTHTEVDFSDFVSDNVTTVKCLITFTVSPNTSPFAYLFKIRQKGSSDNNHIIFRDTVPNTSDVTTRYTYPFEVELSYDKKIEVTSEGDLIDRVEIYLKGVRHH